MRKLMLAGALTLVPLAGCQSANAPTVPTALTSAGDVSISAALASPAQVGRMVSCPSTATIDVVIVAGNVNLFVTEITPQFLDRNGAPSVTLPAPIPTAQFGSALVTARSSRLFPVGFAFACGTAPIGFVAMTVRGTDANGAGLMRTVNVRVN